MHSRVRDMVRTTLNLSPADLLAPPKPYRVAAWHIARVQDANFSGLMERPQLWLADSACALPRPPDPKDYGSGPGTPEQVDAFRVDDRQLLLDYLDAVT
jgi:hypothetical protein